MNVRELPIFTEIEDLNLRCYNRGAILANIYEANKDSEDEMLYLINLYLSFIPPFEVGDVKRYMGLHLIKRGYTIGS